MTEPKTYTLHLLLDMEQITPTLQYHFDEDGEPCSMEHTGKFAGAYCFKKGDLLDFRVSVFVDHPAIQEDTIHLKDLALICLPMGSVKQPALSPYDPESAAVLISDWNDPVVAPGPKDNMITLVFGARSQMEILADDGQWEFSGYLSARIHDLSVKGQETYCRVFSFDPDVVVGGGKD